MTYIDRLYENKDIEGLKAELSKIERIIAEHEVFLSGQLTQTEREKFIKTIQEEKENLEKVKQYLAELLSSEGNT